MMDDEMMTRLGKRKEVKEIGGQDSFVDWGD